MTQSKTAFLFPGQGAQAVGMGAEIFAASAEAREVLAAAESALDESPPLGTIMAQGDEATLTMTRNAQPALMTTALAVLRALEAKSGRAAAELADGVAGHSLGEYAALAAAGCFDVAVAAKLLRKRGDAMQNAVAVGEGAMAALLGVDVDAVEKLLGDLDVGRATASEASVSRAQKHIVDIANDNAPGQVVISGAVVAVDAVLAAAKDSGIRKAVKLPVSAPFHCRLMQPAAEVMAEALAQTEIAAPAMPVWCNVTASAVSDPATLRENLVAQVTGRVRWRETLLNMRADGFTRFAEIGTGKVLSGLVKRTLDDAEVFSLQNAEDIDAFIAAL